MDQEQKMITNLETKYDKSLEEWIKIIKSTDLKKHGEIVKFLKSEHGFSHGFANLVAHKTLKSDAGSVNQPDDLIAAQYKGKEHFLPLFEKLKDAINLFGEDVGFAPKKTYLSVRRKKQFAMLVPATKARYDIGVNLKGAEPEGILEIDTKTNGMCSHRISLTSADGIEPEVFNWLKKAYEKAG